MCSTAAAISPAGRTKTTSAITRSRWIRERGRVLLGAARVADHASSPFLATFHYGRRARHRRRRLRAHAGGCRRRDMPRSSTPPAAAALQPLLDQLAAPGGRLLIEDSLTYTRNADRSRRRTVTDPEAPSVVVGAATGARPLIAASGTMTLEIAANGTLLLDGLVISGGALRLPAAADNEPRTLILRDCTLVPGLALTTNGDPLTPAAPSLIIEHPFTKIRLRALHHRPAARARRLGHHGRARRLHRRCARRIDGIALRRGCARAVPAREVSLDRMHGDRHAAHRAAAPRVQLHLHRHGARAAPPGGLHALQLRARRIDHAAPLQVPAGQLRIRTSCRNSPRRDMPTRATASCGSPPRA